MRDAENISDVGRLLPDYMGFIFHPVSPRYVGEQFSVPHNLPSAIIRVGVFVNENVEIILDRAKTFNLSAIQLHGNEPASICFELKSNGLKVIKAFSIGENFDFSLTRPYKAAADYFLFDTKGKYYGGNAVAFDWNILKHYDQEVPFFLSGGLSSENLGAVSSLVHMNLHAVDLNSGVESGAGMKDLIKIRSVIQALEAAY